MSIRSYKQITPSIDSSVYVDDSAVLVGDIEIGEQSSIWPLVAVQDGTIIHVDEPSQNGLPCIIGEDVLIGHKCMLHGCSLGNRILVGMGAIIMDGAIVQDDVFVAAGALVAPNKVLESGFLYVGNPAVKKRPLKESEQAFLKQSALNYVKLGAEYLAETA